MEKLKLEKAVSLLDEGIRRFPNDTLIIDLYTDLLIQLGEHDKAKQVSIIIMLILALAYWKICLSEP